MARPDLRRIEALFHRIADLETDEQTAILDAECAGEPKLRAAVEELLHQDAQTQTERWLSSPIERSTSPRRVTQATREGSGAPVPPLTALPGYEILEELGRGGMGVVFKARQTALSRLVALKILLPASPATAEQIARFRTEAEALARLQHPNIVQIYDLGEHQGRHYLAMEYVAGPNLARRLDGRPQPIHDSARLVEMLARAIQLVHDRGLLHRDLKPANVLLAAVEATEPISADLGEDVHPVQEFAVMDYGVPKITDFGVALERDAKSRLTQTGVAIGTPCYMAPEQASGQKGHVSPAVDTYALGALLYEMLTGRPPFSGATAEQTIALLLLEDPVSPVRLRPDLPRDLATICLKCLEKYPHRRYARAVDLADDLRRFQEGRPVRARPVGAFGRTWRWCHRRPLVAGLVALCAVLALSLVSTVLIYEARLRANLAKQLVDTTHELADTDQAFGTRVLEDGDCFMALLWFAEAVRLDRDRPEQEQTVRAWIATAMANAPRLVKIRWCDSEVICAELGPAGLWAIAADERGRMQMLDLRTGLRIGPTFQPWPGWRPVGISADGRLIALAMGKAFEVWDRDRAKPVTAPIGQPAPIVQVSFGADNRIALARDANGGAQGWFLSSRRRLGLADDHGGEPLFAAHSPDGRWLVTLYRGHRGRVWDGTTGKAVGPAFDVARQTVVAAPSSDGLHVALAAGDAGLWLVNIRTNTRRLLCSVPHREGPIQQVQFSPDGTQLLSIAGDHVSVWDVRSGARLAPPVGYQAALVAAGFGASRSIITIGKRGPMEVWELPELQQTARIPEATSNPAARMHSIRAAFGGNRAIDVRAASPTVLQAIARVLSGKRLDHEGHPVPLKPSEWRAAWDTVQSQQG